jgi:preprotein translocase subunit SecA
MFGFIKKLFDPMEKDLARYRAITEEVNELEPEIKSLSDRQLKGKTEEFKQRLRQGQTLDDILVEAFAVVREVAVRTLEQRHYDVQVMGACALHEGNIAEMKTGEGKTLAATMPIYLNALEEKGAHLVTVNDYLAKRDAEWMGQIYESLGMSVGVIVPGLSYEERREAYGADITYGTNNEFGFDYLRDNMVTDKSQLVQGDLNYAILDEVDSILIDEARTPLIISGSSGKSTEMYHKFASIAPQLKEGTDYNVDEKAQTVVPTEEGISRVESLLGIDNLYDNEHMDLSHYLNQALKAQVLMKRDQDYVVMDGQVVIVDEFTGRLMIGRRYSDGLHQAIEAKERVDIQEESQTLATITFQNFFRMYNKVAGMTGTAKTEEDEFREVYGMDVVVIPTNEPMIREDLPDVVYKAEEAKFRAIVEDVVRRHERGQPVLVGTVSIENSEKLSDMLSRRGVPHEVLNAKHHAREAEIVAGAGQPGAVTIATNMAGRGTDIVLGEGVVDLGGLHILGSERHESRRIDNQLRGRAGRQGDPGSSQFFVSLEDDLMRLFGSERIMGIMDSLGVEEDVPIEHNLLSTSIENAQKKVEARNFDMRKRVLQYDDVMNRQREVIYSQRRRVLEGHKLRENIESMIEEVVEASVLTYADESLVPEEWDLEGLSDFLRAEVLPADSVDELELNSDSFESVQELMETVLDHARQCYTEKEEALGEELMAEFERVIMLKVVDQKWMDHLDAMDSLREGIGLRAYAQQQPLVEYQREAYELFTQLEQAIRHDIVKYLFKVEVSSTPQAEAQYSRTKAVHSGAPAVSAIAAAAGATATGAATTNKEPAKPQPIVKGEKIGRNDPCPCGSGKKYKRCCGR